MIVFLGLLYSPDDEKRILGAATQSYQAAANNFQWGILRGLRKNADEKIVVLNSIPMGSFPRHSSIFHEKTTLYLEDGIELHNCGYINLPLVKQHQRCVGIYNLLMDISTSEQGPIIVITYSLYLPYLKALHKFAKNFSALKTVLIVPDLPGEFGIMSSNPFRRCIEYTNARKVYSLAEESDGYVFLTEHMKYALKIQNNKYAVVEGVYSGDSGRFVRVSDVTPKTILYTGTLDRSLGIETLLDAFEKLPKGLSQLRIAGSGGYETDLRERCKNNHDIHYLGFVSKDEVQQLQNEATVLVNPRSSKEEYTKYSFPSKTMEYLASGKPVVMNKLPGIPKEYYEHIYFTETDDVDGLANKLYEVLQTDPLELQKKSEKARSFILKEKNGTTQAKKILDLINSL